MAGRADRGGPPRRGAGGGSIPLAEGHTGQAGDADPDGDRHNGHHALDGAGPGHLRHPPVPHQAQGLGHGGLDGERARPDHVFLHLHRPDGAQPVRLPGTGGQRARPRPLVRHRHHHGVGGARGDGGTKRRRLEEKRQPHLDVVDRSLPHRRQRAHRLRSAVDQVRWKLGRWRDIGPDRRRHDEFRDHGSGPQHGVLHPGAGEELGRGRPLVTQRPEKDRRTAQEADNRTGYGPGLQPDQSLLGQRAV